MYKNNKTIEELHKNLVEGDFTVRDLVEQYIKEIENTKNINAVLESYSKIDEYIDNAQRMLDEGKSTLLTGIPCILKDNLLLDREKVGAASKILEGYNATYDATVVKKLKNEGVVFLGRANMDEFAMGGSTENSAYGVTKNPLDTSRVPGGSSGGSAAAVAAQLCVFSLGTDTGGSIRQPASFCGLVGLKPTYGRVSRYGAISMGSSLDQIGPLTKTVMDSEIVYDAIKGLDTMDATTVDGNSTIDFNKKIGVPYSFIKSEGVSKETLENFEKCIDGLKKSGYEIIDVSLPYIHYALSVYYIVMPAEVSSNLARFDGIRYGLSLSGASSSDTFSKTRGKGFGNEVRRRILLGTYILSHGYYDAYYNKALLVKNKLQQQFEDVFKQVSTILTPTTPTTAFKIGEKSDPLSMYMADIFTVPANIVGVPALSVPYGSDIDGMPFGVQVTAPHFCEDFLFRVGKDIEKLI